MEKSAVALAESERTVDAQSSERPVAGRADRGPPAIERPSFKQRDCTDQDFRRHEGRDAQLANVDFSGATLVRCNFSGLDLSGANFEGADLTDARLAGCDLTRARLLGANFTRAALAGAILEKSGIEDVQLAGADLSGAVAGTVQAKLEKRLELAKALASDLRSLFIAACGLFAYIGATVLSASDALVLTNTATMELPIVNARVSVHAFFQLASIFILALSSYTLARVSHFARVVSKLPAHLPEGPPLREQVDPWVLSCVGILQRGALSPGEGLKRIRPVFELFGARVPGVIVRWMGPVVLWYLTLRFFFACQLQLSAWRANLGFVFLVAAFLGSCTIAFGLRSYSEFVDGAEPPTKASVYASTAVAALAVAMGFRFVVQSLNLRGAPGETLSGAQLTGANLTHWNFAASNLDKANLGSANLDGTRFQEAILTGTDLRRASMTGASFISAVMTGCNLAVSEGTRPVFLQADLSECDLRHAKLPGAIFQGAKLNGANLKSLSAPSMIAANAEFFDAILDDADLSFAMLNGASFKKVKEGTTLFRAKLNDADLSSTSFRGAQMFLADLHGANLSYATFDEAHISRVNLSGALLLSTKFKVAEAWGLNLSGARLENVTIAPPGPPFVGRTTFDSSNFVGAQLKTVTFDEINLWGADFTDAQLDGVDFRASELGAVKFGRAHFANVKLAGAKNFDRSKLSQAQLQGTDLTTGEQR